MRCVKHFIEKLRAVRKIHVRLLNNLFANCLLYECHANFSLARKVHFREVVRVDAIPNNSFQMHFLNSFYNTLLLFIFILFFYFSLFKGVT